MKKKQKKEMKAVNEYSKMINEVFAVYYSTIFLNTEFTEDTENKNTFFEIQF